MAGQIFSVTASALNLRSAPGVTNPMVAVLSNGTLVKSLADALADGWMNVSVPARDNISGWVKASFLAAGAGGGSAGPGTATGGAVDPDKKDRDLTKLHPVMRRATVEILDTLKQENIPFAAFEAYRHPVRQNWLFAQGRTRPGNIVTHAQAWQSYHQYGLAVDFVLLFGSVWSWDDSGDRAAFWKRLHELGAKHGLERLRFETPHLQVAGLKVANLKLGELPGGGDDSWLSNLEDVARAWRSSGAQPAGPGPFDERPPLPSQ